MGVSDYICLSISHDIYNTHGGSRLLCALCILLIAVNILRLLITCYFRNGATGATVAFPLLHSLNRVFRNDHHSLAFLWT
jgi:hypothetical protein